MLALYVGLLLVWTWIVSVCVFPVMFGLGVVLAAAISYGVLSFPSIKLNKKDLSSIPWYQTPLTNVNFRTPLVVAFVLPASLVFDLFWFLRTRYIQSTLTHEQKVRRVQKQVLAWKASGSKTPMCTARGGWLTISPKQSSYKNDSHRISIEMYEVLEIDEKDMTVRVEPGVNMSKLSHHLLQHGYRCPVLPEMDDLTVGGLINGCGVEVSSHKYGMFQAICVAFEIMLADGSVKTVTATSEPDMFYAIPWSYGSVGFLMSAKLKIEKSAKYVRLEYFPTSTEAEFTETFEKYTLKGEQAPEFVEGLIFDQNRAVVMVGDLADVIEEGGHVNDLSLWYKPWFFIHASNFNQHTVEYVPLRAYFHRHTRSIFWEIQDMLPQTIGNNFFFRLILGWIMTPKVAFLKLIQPEAMRLWYEKQHVIQDMLVPLSSMKKSLQIFREHYDLYPLWVCPMKVYDVPGMIHPATQQDGKNEDMFVDLGAYGIPSKAYKGTFDAQSAAVAVEKFVRDVQGFQMLYADCYLTEDEFKHMFSTEHLMQVRKKVGAVGAFPTPYQKICRRVATK